MATPKAERAQPAVAQLCGIVLLAVGLGWAFGWWWTLVVLGLGLVAAGVGEEWRRNEKPAPVAPDRRFVGRG